MNKVITSCSMLVSVLVFSSSLYASPAKCIPSYVNALLKRSIWMDDKLVDHEKGYSYVVTNLTTQKLMLSSSQDAKHIASAQVHSANYNQDEKACVIKITKENGNQLSLKLNPKKLSN